MRSWNIMTLWMMGKVIRIWAKSNPHAPHEPPHVACSTWGGATPKHSKTCIPATQLEIQNMYMIWSWIWHPMGCVCHITTNYHIGDYPSLQNTYWIDLAEHNCDYLTIADLVTLHKQSMLLVLKTNQKVCMIWVCEDPVEFFPFLDQISSGTCAVVKLSS